MEQEFAKILLILSDAKARFSINAPVSVPFLVFLSFAFSSNRLPTFRKSKFLKKKNKKRNAEGKKARKILDEKPVTGKMKKTNSQDGFV